MATKMVVEKLYESENFLVINKPYDMYINSDDENEKNTVTHQIASGDSHLSTSAQPLHFVQRLDYSTSGVLCIAKTKQAAAAAGKLFEKRLTRKYYFAIVRGHVKQDCELCDIHFDVGIDPRASHTSHRMVARTSSSSMGPNSVRGSETTVGFGSECELARTAHTRLLLLETGYYKGEPVSVVLLKPITGRRHQLRVHCAALGHVIVGDYTYSNAQDCAPHRMFLHAARLVLPVATEPLDIQTAEPFFSDPEFAALWKSERAWYKYRTKQDFVVTCEILDKTYVLGVTYKHFYCAD